jgi:hypothetical protein
MLAMKPTDIEKYRYDLEVIRMTAEQVKKDFAIQKMEITFSGNEMNAYEELKSQLIPHLSKMLSGNRSQLMQLLYRIDVPERDWKKVVMMDDENAQTVRLTEIILEREFMKALTRKMFSGK